jgi:hypothetical protein
VKPDKTLKAIRAMVDAIQDGPDGIDVVIENVTDKYRLSKAQRAEVLKHYSRVAEC